MAGPRREHLPDKLLYRDEAWFEALEKGEERRTEEVKPSPSERMTAPPEEQGDAGPLVPCKVGPQNCLFVSELQSTFSQVCSRSFAADRIAKHVVVCDQINTKTRQPYDVAGMRVAGTEAEELVKAGKMTLEPAKVIPKKTDLSKQMEVARANASTAKPATAAAKSKMPEKGKATAKGASGEAYQVMFDDRGPAGRQTGKPAKNLPTQMVRGQTGKPGQDLRYLSAKNNWRNKNGVSPDFNSSLSEDDYDFLAASMTSTKTVQSDAFDFLFDENNLNPEKVHDHLNEFNRQDSRKEDHTAAMTTQKNSECCVVS